MAVQDNDLVLDPLFEHWFEEAAMRFGWVQIPEQFPDHSWDWPSHPVADTKALADTNERRLKTGQATLTKIYSEQGEDFEDHVQRMAEDFGVTEDRMRQILLMTTFNDRGAISSMQQAENAQSQGATQDGR